MAFNCILRLYIRASARSKTSCVTDTISDTLQRPTDGQDLGQIPRIHTVIEPADAFFPEIDPALWQETLRSIRYHDDASGYDYTFLLYERRK